MVKDSGSCTPGMFGDLKIKNDYSKVLYICIFLSRGSLQKPYVLMTPLTGLGTPQVLAGRDSWVLPTDVQRLSGG